MRVGGSEDWLIDEQRWLIFIQNEAMEMKMKET